MLYSTVGAKKMEASATLADDEFGLVGQVLEEKISVESVLACGGFSVVYAGRHHNFEQAVAIKCLRTTGLPRSQVKEYLARFRREGQLLLKLCLATPNVVRIIDMGHTTRENVVIPYLVLERLEGSPLGDWFDARVRGSLPPLTLEEMVRLLDSGAEALAQAHSMGVAHRDVKPSNLWVVSEKGRRERVKLIDFGIAKEFDVSVPSRHLQTQVAKPTAYTPTYGAPEQFARGKGGATGPHTDVFAFALVCVELLSGLPALGEDDNDLTLRQEATRTDRRPTPRAKGVNVTDDVEAVFVRALAVDIQDRYANVAEFWRALSLAARFPIPGWLSSSGFPPASSAGDGGLAAPPAPAPIPPSSGSPTNRSRPAPETAPAVVQAPPAPARAEPHRAFWPYALGLAAIVGLGIAAFAFMSTGTPPPSIAASPGPPSVSSAKAPPGPAALSTARGAHEECTHDAECGKTPEGNPLFCCMDGKGVCLECCPARQHGGKDTPCPGGQSCRSERCQ